MATGDIHERCRDEIAAVITALGLTAASPPGEPEVVTQFLADVHGLPENLPVILVSIDGLSEEELDGTFESEEVGYPVLVAILDRAAKGESALHAVYLQWRKQIMSRLRSLTELAGADEVFDVRVTGRVALDPAGPMYQLIQSACVATCVANEARVRS